MASAIAKPQKRLGEFLKEQQEPFLLEVYLLEREYSQNWSLNGDHSTKSLERSASSSSGINNKKGKALLPFSEILSALHKKLAFHNESSASVVSRDPDNRNEGVSVPELGSVDQIAVEPEADRFSSAGSSTVFNSCSDTDENETSFSSGTRQASSVSCNVGLQSQQATNNGKNRQRCIEGETVSEDVRGKEQRTRSCGVLLPKKITEDSLLSAALWGLLIQSAKRESYSMELRELLGPNVSQLLKSKRVLHKTKKLLFDCVREITTTLPRKADRQQGYKQFTGPEELGKLICEKTKEWGQHARDETNLTYLLTLDYLNSINEWSKFELHVKDISGKIADAILECVNNEIVSEMIEISAPNI